MDKVPSLHVIPLTQGGTTPLYIASEQGWSDVVNTLIRNGATINLAKNVLCISYVHCSYNCRSFSHIGCITGLLACALL